MEWDHTFIETRIEQICILICGIQAGKIRHLYWNGTNYKVSHEHRSASTLKWSSSPCTSPRHSSNRTSSGCFSLGLGHFAGSGFGPSDAERLFPLRPHVPQHDGTHDRIHHQITTQKGSVFEGKVPVVGQREWVSATDFEEWNGGVDDGHFEQDAGRVKWNPGRISHPCHEFVGRSLQGF